MENIIHGMKGIKFWIMLKIIVTIEILKDIKKFRHIIGFLLILFSLLFIEWSLLEKE